MAGQNGSGRHHWSNAAPEARFFIINAWAGVAWLVVILWPRWWTATIAVVLSAMFLFVRSKKMTLLGWFKSKKVFFVGHRIRVEKIIGKD